MNKKHEKSACCRADIIKFGKRRRRCVGCRHTWSVWKKKRGRKRKRINTDFVRSFLNHEIASLASLSRKRKCSESKLQQKLARSRTYFIQTEPWPHIPDGALILVADAVVEFIEKKWRTVYLMLVRKISKEEAIILPPFFGCGTETAGTWRVAINTIPPDVLTRINAMVCDGHIGLVAESKRHGWLLQRCHFHLLARIQSRRSLWRIARHKVEAGSIFKNVRHVLECPDNDALNDSLAVLKEISRTSSSPEIRRVLSGFIRNYRDYRTYLNHPEFHLPTTNNTAESLAGTIANLKHRLRGFPTLQSFTKWIHALLKFKKKIKCNGFHQQK